MPKPYTPNDKWSQRAAREGFRARSVYKLQEIDEKFRLLKPGMTVLDLGAAPGSWSQYAMQKVGGSGSVIALDLQEIEPIDGVQTHIVDITDIETLHALLPKSTDVIISDLAPKTSGIKDVDQWRSIELSEAVLSVADEILRPGGRVVMKILRGADFDEFLKNCKVRFNDVQTFIAKASRDRSKEIYVIAKKK